MILAIIETRLQYLAVSEAASSYTRSLGPKPLRAPGRNYNNNADRIARTGFQGLRSKCTYNT